MDKKFYKMVLMLVIPIALQNIINVGIQSLDVIMLGKVGEIELSASSLAGQVNFIMNLVLFGLASGMTVLTAQYWGKGDKQTIEKVTGIAMKFGFVIGLFFMIVSFVFARQIMHIFSSEEEVINEGIKYLRIICFSFILSVFTTIYLSAMRSMSRVIISTVVYFISFFVNLIFNSILIFGLCGFPKMGIKGAAIGTLVARFFEIIVVLFYNKKFNDIFKLRNTFLHFSSKELRVDFTKFSIPVIMNELLWGLGISVTAAILGQMGKSVAAANSVVQVTRQLAMVVSIGIANATAIIIGKVIGEGKLDVAKIYGRKLIRLSIISGLCGGLLVLGIRPMLLRMLTISTAAQQNLSFMMIILSYYVMFQAISCTGIVGVLRAGGDTKYGVIVDVSTLWFGSILFGYLASYVWKLPFSLIYVILLIDEPLKIPLVYMRYRSYNWLKCITRTQNECSNLEVIENEKYQR